VVWVSRKMVGEAVTFWCVVVVEGDEGLNCKFLIHESYFVNDPKY